MALAMGAQKRQSLAEIGRFYGSGQYAIYYEGAFPLYASLSRSETPIYVGQASPETSSARTPLEQGERLCRRLVEHSKNIWRAVDTLDVNEFAFRLLVVQSGWETAAEDYFIYLFTPIGNSEPNILYGLGKHGDSADTRSNDRSPWDTIHPGRTWAADPRLPGTKPREQIVAEVEARFVAHLVYPDLELVLESFIDELRQV